MSAIILETPANAAALYAAQGQDVDPYRPAFTGDVYRTEAGAMYLIVQHPCALRRGTKLSERLLLVEVSGQNGLPRDWSEGHFKVMPLPALVDGLDYAGRFDSPYVIRSIELADMQRVASMSQLGVNLLLQRWVYHNSRVVIPTFTYDLQTAGPFEEADLAAEWCAALDGSVENAEGTFDTWLGDRSRADDAQTRRERLSDSQQRSAIRKEMRLKLQ